MICMFVLNSSNAVHQYPVFSEEFPPGGVVITIYAGTGCAIFWGAFFQKENKFWGIIFGKITRSHKFWGDILER